MFHSTENAVGKVHQKRPFGRPSYQLRDCQNQIGLVLDNQFANKELQIEEQTHREIAKFQEKCKRNLSWQLDHKISLTATKYLVWKLPLDKNRELKM